MIESLYKHLYSIVNHLVALLDWLPKMSQSEPNEDKADEHSQYTHGDLPGTPDDVLIGHHSPNRRLGRRTLYEYVEGLLWST